MRVILSGVSGGQAVAETESKDVVEEPEASTLRVLRSLLEGPKRGRNSSRAAMLLVIPRGDPELPARMLPDSSVRRSDRHRTAPKLRCQ